MPDPFVALKAYLEASTNFPHFLTLVLAYLLVIGASAGVVAGIRHAVKEKKKTLLLAILALLAVGTYLWVHRPTGTIALLALAAYALRKPIRGLLRLRREKRDRNRLARGRYRD